MPPAEPIRSPDAWAARIFAPLKPLYALAARVYVGWQFFASGYTMARSWNTTLYLFESEYRVPVLAPHAAALAGTLGELFFPLLLIVGAAGRLAAAGLFAVNLVAVISYAHVLFSDGSEAALQLHAMWGGLLLFLMIFGPGSWSLDRWFERSWFERSAR